jgi:hypothetical protein
MMSEARRLFLKHSALIARRSPPAGGRPAGRRRPSKATPASEKLARPRSVGVNGRGMSHVGGFNGRNGCEIVAICDCDEG